jgi:transposase, IS5 family
MGEQRTFASVAWSQKSKVTRRERFLTEMDAVIPWKSLLPSASPWSRLPTSRFEASLAS